jgi:F-type H+-transporting ATPase subunit a
LKRPVKWAIFIGLVVFACAWMGSPMANWGKFPTISLPAETVFTIGPLTVTNTLIVTVIADVALILFALRATRKVRKGAPDAEIPRGVQNIFELIIDMLYGLSKSVAGSKAIKIFPWMATIFLFVLFANWTELFPGIESIGTIVPAHEGIGYPKQELIPGVLYTVDQSQPIVVDEATVAPAADSVAAEAEKQQEVEAAHGEALPEAFHVLPFFRTPTSDINTTLALALITMFMVQVFGVRALGGRYFYKFVNIPELRRGGLGIMMFIVGFLELISEVARILSFTFRLLGNIFAGGVLLLVMTFIVPFFIPMPFLGLELFVGFIQALVFAMLALVFMNMAMASHGDHGEEHH